MADASDQRPAPSAVGTLANRPLVHLLVYARNRSLTGKLELHAAGGRNGTVDLWRGRITGARTAPPVAYFGTVAYELGMVDTVTLDATLLEISKTKRLHGEVLVERRALTPLQRDDVLREQACRKIHHLFSLPPEASFAFYDARPPANDPPFTLDPIKPAWRGLRENAPVDSVREVLARFATTALRLSNEGPVARAGFTIEETALCEALIRKSMNLAQLRATSALPAARVDLLVYLLVITKCAEPAVASTPAMPATRTSEPNIPAARASQPSIAVPPSRPAMRAGAPPDSANRTSSSAGMPAADSGEMRISLSFRVPSVTTQSANPSSTRTAAKLAPTFGPSDLGAAGIAHRAQSVDSEDLFEALGLPDGAPAEAARAAYFRLARLWHPDKLAPDLAPFRSEVEKIFSHMTRAHVALTDPAAHRAYLATHDQAAAASAITSKPRKDVIRNIEQELAKRDFLSAEQTARHLVDHDPDDTEAQALVAWAATSAGEAAEETLRALLPELDRVVKQDTYCERAYFYRGVFHKRLGNGAAAFRDFTHAVRLNPKHVDAQREIRIFEMRARKGSGEHALDVLISKAKKK